jgi:hypothetical protein
VGQSVAVQVSSNRNAGSWTVTPFQFRCTNVFNNYPHNKLFYF